MCFAKGIDKKKVKICIEEIQRAQDEYENWQIIDACMNAIEEGKVTGTINEPNTKDVQTDKIHVALSRTREMARNTKNATAWTTACEILGILRDSLVTQNFKRLEEKVDNIQYDSLPAEAVTEIKLIEHVVRDNKAFTS